MKNSTPLMETGNPDLIARAYNLGLKIVPNLAHVLSQDDLEYWESNLGEIKTGLRSGFVRSRETGIISPNPRFELASTFQVTLPENYEHATWLASFAAKHRKGFSYGYNDNVTDANFAGATQKLMPGKTYGVKIWDIGRGENVSSPDCVLFYKTQKMLLVGAQGLTLAWEQKKDEFSKGKWTASFDEEKALPYHFGYRYRMVPYVRVRSGDDFGLDLCGFARGWGSSDCLLGFCDE